MNLTALGKFQDLDNLVLYTPSYQLTMALAVAKASPSKYHKVRYTDAIEASLDHGEFTVDGDYVEKISPGHGLVIAEWDEQNQQGHVRYLGVAIRVSNTTGIVKLDWAEAEITLKPNPGGRRWWRNQYFGFAPDVVARYMLDDLFAEHFPDYSDIELERSVGAKSIRRGYLERQGYVYVLKSEYGYKIGKAVNVTNRTKQFGVKLPFKWDIVATKASSDYSRLESDLHCHFADKRLEGEWFDLNDTDLKNIQLWPTDGP